MCILIHLQASGWPLIIASGGVYFENNFSHLAKNCPQYALSRRWVRRSFWGLLSLKVASPRLASYMASHRTIVPSFWLNKVFTYYLLIDTKGS